MNLGWAQRAVGQVAWCSRTDIRNSCPVWGDGTAPLHGKALQPSLECCPSEARPFSLVTWIPLVRHGSRPWQKSPAGQKGPSWELACAVRSFLKKGFCGFECFFHVRASLSCASFWKKGPDKRDKSVSDLYSVVCLFSVVDCSAVDNQVYVATASPARDEKASYVAWGHSTVVSPWWVGSAGTGPLRREAGSGRWVVWFWSDPVPPSAPVSPQACPGTRSLCARSYPLKTVREGSGPALLTECSASALFWVSEWRSLSTKLANEAEVTGGWFF